MKKILLCVLTLAGCTHTPERHYRYKIILPDNVSVWPVLCDSIVADGLCLNYYRDGGQGRICGTYTVLPQ